MASRQSDGMYQGRRRDDGEAGGYRRERPSSIVSDQREQGGRRGRRENHVSCPLYDKLADMRDDEDDISWVVPTIAALSSRTTSSDHHENIYILILHHEFLTSGSVLCEVPYGGVPLPGQRGIIYRENNLPIPLLRIMGRYLKTFSAAIVH